MPVFVNLYLYLPEFVNADIGQIQVVLANTVGPISNLSTSWRRFLLFKIWIYGQLFWKMFDNLQLFFTPRVFCYFCDEFCGECM